MSRRVMAVDYGNVRTGVALSDLTATLAGQALVLTQTGKALVARLVELAHESDAAVVVVGCPRNMDGSYGPAAQKSQTLAAKLEEAGLRVILRDERLTTVDAHKILSMNDRRGSDRKAKVDAVAASLILQNYLDFLNNSVNPT